MRPHASSTSLITKTSVGLSSTSNTVRALGSAEPSSTARCYQVREGREKQKVDPPPGEDCSSQMRPPYCSTTRWQIANPIPLPGYSSRPCRRLKRPKILLGILRFDSNPIINHGKHAPAVPLVGCDMDTWNLLTAVFDGVADQVLKQLRQPAFMDRNRRQFRAVTVAPASLESALAGFPGHLASTRAESTRGAGPSSYFVALAYARRS